MSIKTALMTTFLLAACQEAAPTTNEVGLKLTQFDDGHVTGQMVTASGIVDFAVAETTPGVVDVRFDRGHGQFGTTIDWNAQTADFAWPDAMQVTDDDRFVLTALALAVENELGKDTNVTDNLFRQASLWGAHPVGDVILKPIVADGERGYTSLCSAGACNSTAPSRGFSHSGGSTERSAPCGSHSSTTKTYTRKFGRRDTINPCLSRCGGGCSGVGTSAYTQDCGNHDLCEYWHTSGCGGELTSASDDYTLAKNCGC
jgi:hypothetical protein